jgi:hypothetical protein
MEISNEWREIKDVIETVNADVRGVEYRENGEGLLSEWPDPPSWKCRLLKMEYFGMGITVKCNGGCLNVERYSKQIYYYNFCKLIQLQCQCTCKYIK